MRDLPRGTLEVFPVRTGEHRVSFYDQATVVRQASGKHHGGVDIGGELGTPVLAATGGRVPVSLVIGGDVVPGAGTRETSGHYVVVVSPSGHFFYYFHLDSVAPGIAPASVVEAGQLLGGMGNSGLARRAGRGTAPVHLHFQTQSALHRFRRSKEWYEELEFPVPNRTAVNPFGELARLAHDLEGAVPTRDRVQGVERAGFVIRKAR